MSLVAPVMRTVDGVEELIMKYAFIGQIDMGDRDPASVTLRGNILTLGKSRYRSRAVNMRIP